MPRSVLIPVEPLTLTVEQLAARLQLSVRAIHQQRAIGVFPFAPLPGLGRRLLFSRAEVEAQVANASALRFQAGERFRSRRLTRTG